MKSKVEKTLIKVIGIGAHILLIVFALFFALLSIAALLSFFTDKDFLAIIGVGASATLSWVCWSVRKDIML